MPWQNYNKIFEPINISLTHLIQLLFLFLTTSVNSVSMAVWDYSVYSCIVVSVSGIQRCMSSASQIRGWPEYKVQPEYCGH